MFRAGLLCALLLFVSLVKAEELSGSNLVAELRKGGYVLYIRHTSTDFSKDDSKSSSFEDCANQRPLTDKGRAEARGGPVKSDDPKRYDGLRKLLSTPPAQGRNNVISSHGNPFYALFGSPYLAEGEVAVVRPGSQAGFELLARIMLADWSALQH